jgi:trans-2,3-dihydro-3-hydroxyanthranilate isomerase
MVGLNERSIPAQKEVTFITNPFSTFNPLTRRLEMTNHTFYIVDVFAEQKYSGNQLAVFRDTADLSTDEMQAIAREMHFSETTFILSDEPHDGGYDVRIFTPREELPFAGHPTLGTAFVIQQEIIGQPVEQMVLNLQVGQIPVTFDGDILWMKQVEPEFGRMLDASQLAPVLNLDEDDFDPRFPIEEVSTGLPHIIVPLKRMDGLKRANVDRERYFRLIENTWAKPIMIFCPGGYNEEQDLGVRMFADCFGIAEDPATGSGSGCLAGYLIKRCYFGANEIDIRTGQGYEVNRPSTLYLRAADRGREIEVHVGGKVVKIAAGEFV